MEKLTFGQVLDKLQLDEVAIKVGGERHSEIIKGMKECAGGLHYDTDDNNILKDLDGFTIIIVKGDKSKEEDSYVIIKKELYNLIVVFESVGVPVKEKSSLEDEFYFQHHAEVTDFTYHAKRIGERTYEISWYSKSKGKSDYQKYNEDIVKDLINNGTWVVK